MPQPWSTLACMSACNADPCQLVLLSCWIKSKPPSACQLASCLPYSGCPYVAGDWFCCEGCSSIRAALMQQVEQGAVPLEGEGLSWQMLRGTGDSDANAATLATATALLQACLLMLSGWEPVQDCFACLEVCSGPCDCCRRGLATLAVTIALSGQLPWVCVSCLHALPCLQLAAPAMSARKAASNCLHCTLYPQQALCHLHCLHAELQLWPCRRALTPSLTWAQGRTWCHPWCLRRRLGTGTSLACSLSSCTTRCSMPVLAFHCQTFLYSVWVSTILRQVLLSNVSPVH